MGYILMSQNPINDPKVCYDWGESRVPDVKGKMLELFVKAYKEGAKKLVDLGF